MKKVCVLLAEGFEEIEALTVVDLLRRARIYVDTAAVADEYMVRGSHGIAVQTEDLFSEVDFEDFDMLVLPGGLPGTTNLGDHSGVRKVIRDFAEKDKYIAAICAAPTLLGSLGLLKGKRATCYPSMEKQISGAVLTGAPVMSDGNIITGQGVGAAIEFALNLIAVLMGDEKAQEIAEAIVYH
ncbi:DJ-1 family glyoxalase III [Lachnospiraceae bacterium 42-17]|nr:DJ-1/PfpI family protein [Dorea sp.]